MINTELHLHTLPFWDKLSDDEKQTLKNNAVIRKYSKGEIVNGCHTSCLGMILVTDGELRAYILSDEGREITLFRTMQNEICILSASCVISQITFDTHIVSQKDTEMLIIPSNTFSSVIEKNIYARCFMYEKITEHFSSVMFSLQQILFMKFDSRLASFLINEYQSTGKNEIKMTQELIAQHVNSAREVVARMLKRFVSDGLIEMKRGSIHILDADGLKALI